MTDTGQFREGLQNQICDLGLLGIVREREWRFQRSIGSVQIALLDVALQFAHYCDEAICTDLVSKRNM